MAEYTPRPPSIQDPADETSAPLATHDESAPRWVKVFGIISLVVIGIVVIIHLAGGGFHGHAMQ